MVQYLKTIQYITTFGIQCGEILKFSYSINISSFLYMYILCLDVIWGKSQISVLLLKRIIKRSTQNVFEHLEFICT